MIVMPPKGSIPLYWHYIWYYISSHASKDDIMFTCTLSEYRSSEIIVNINSYKSINQVPLGCRSH